MPLTKNEVELIKAQLEEFVDDFVKDIQPIFELKGWIYAQTEKGVNQVPEINDLKNLCYSLIRKLDVSSWDDFDVESGRIRAWYFKKADELQYGLNLVYGYERVISLE